MRGRRVLVSEDLASGAVHAPTVVTAAAAGADVDGDGSLGAVIILIDALQVVDCGGIGHVGDIAGGVASDFRDAALVRGAQGFGALLDVEAWDED